MKYVYQVNILVLAWLSFSLPCFADPGKAIELDLRDKTAGLYFYNSHYERGNRYDFLFMYLKNVQGKLSVVPQEIAAKCLDVKLFPLAEVGSYFVSTKLEKEYSEDEGTSLCRLHFLEGKTQRKFIVSFGTYQSSGPINPIER